MPTTLNYDIESKKTEKQSAKDYLNKMPADVKKKIISHLLIVSKNNIFNSFDPKNY